MDQRDELIEKLFEAAKFARQCDEMPTVGVLYTLLAAIAADSDAALFDHVCAFSRAEMERIDRLAETEK